MHVFQQVCAALDKLHRAGIAHGDLRPGNVIVDGEGNVKLAGFGFSRLLGEASGKDDVFRAPELRASHQIETPIADIYSLGALGYWMITGTPLVAGSMVTPSSLIPPDFPIPGRRIDDAILCATHYDPERRYPDVEKIAEYLKLGGGRFFLAYGGGDGDAPPPHAQAPRKKKSPWLIALSVGLGLVVIGGTAAGILVLQKTGEEVAERQNDIRAKIAFIMRELARLHEDPEGVWANLEEAVKALPADKATMMRLVEEALKQGRYEEAERIMAMYLAKVGEGDPLYAEFLTEQKKLIEKLDSYRAAMAEAAARRHAGDSAGELEALARALRIFPDDLIANGFLKENPVHLRVELAGALEALQEANPGTPWRARYAIGDGEVALNLAENPHLKDITALAPLPLTTLDLSHTSVGDISALAGMPLRHVHLTGAPVKSLEPLAGAPLEILAFEGAPIPAGGADFLDRFPALRIVRGTVGGEEVARIPPPNGAARWENSLGMSFDPLKSGMSLIATREVRRSGLRRLC
ncbi:MAG: protein kinase [Verrucomicrobiales bacterium]